MSQFSATSYVIDVIFEEKSFPRLRNDGHIADFVCLMDYAEKRIKAEKTALRDWLGSQLTENHKEYYSSTSSNWCRIVKTSSSKVDSNAVPASVQAEIDVLKAKIAELEQPYRISTPGYRVEPNPRR